PRASPSATDSTAVRRAGRKPASVSATVMTAKNSRPAISRRLSGLGVFAVLRVLARLGPAALHAQDAEHGAERDLPEAADRRHPQRLLELRDLLGDVARSLDVLQEI